MQEIPLNDWDYEPLTNDVMFHLVFLTNEKARKALVSVMLNIPENEIGEIVVKNPLQFSDSFDAMQTVLDLRLQLSNGTFINIEMQVKPFPEWTNRTVVYSCRQITDQSNTDGFSYSALEPVIHIAIMNYTLFKDHKKFFAKYEVRDEDGYRYTDKLQFLVMNLKAISKATDEDRRRGLVQWAEAFTAKNWEQIKKIKNSGIQEAVKQMQAVLGNPQQRQMIWSRKLAQMDHDSQIESARTEGIAIGKSEGITEGIAIGKSEGIAIGKSEGIAIGKSEGITEGIAIGQSKGENRVVRLMARLFSLGRQQDAEKATNDVAYREKLFLEFGL
ncbi:MAG: Rpn family recombination-promoting nuclease/putative transposase [Clostridia bacterium]|nr:Rpn family recombination-promoting nuclease/putative transposase [Clostridia bacterium]